MISVAEAEELIKNEAVLHQSTLLQINDLSDAVLCEELTADRDYPPFHRVTMDGIAISSEAWHAGTRVFDVEGVQRAGAPAMTLKAPTTGCIEVMTGAMLPDGCDAVIRYEDTRKADLGIEVVPDVVVQDFSVSKMMNIHQQGADYKKGQRLLSTGAELRSVEWSIAASIGADTVQVVQKPSIAIVCTGDELIEVSEVPEPYQIRKSNIYSLLSSLRAFGFNNVTCCHLRDNMEEMLVTLRKILEDHTCVILSGGVSKGKFDHVPDALAALNVRKVFHRVKQKPGKPLWFGATDDSRLVFGLPGNPVSSLVCLHRYVIPALMRSLGASLDSKPLYAVLTEDIQFEPSLTYFPPVNVQSSARGELLATPVASNGSGDFASLAGSTGFLELPSELNTFKRGAVFPLYTWRRML